MCTLNLHDPAPPRSAALVKHCVLVWSNVQVGILQYGEVAVHEWSLKNYQTTQEVVEAAKNISRQEGRETRTAYAIHKAW